MQDNDVIRSDDLQPEYDFDYAAAVRGKYYQKVMEQGTNVIVLEPDIAETFKDSASVNEALRTLLGLSRYARNLRPQPSQSSESSRY